MKYIYSEMFLKVTNHAVAEFFNYNYFCIFNTKQTDFRSSYIRR